MEPIQPTIPETPTQQPNIPHHYTITGLVIGVVVSLCIIVAMYYKNTMDEIAKQKTQKSQGSVSQQNDQTGDQSSSQQIVQVTPVPSAVPSVTPVTIQSQTDLSTQQNALDGTDMTPITTGVSQNTQDASQFSQ